MEVSRLQEEEQQPPCSSSYWKIISVASIAAGVQFGWALQLSLLTPYVQLLGVPHQWAAFIWLCGPISGMIVQPTVGYFSDRCTSCFGRRRPFIAVGALFVVIAVFLIGYAADIGHRSGDSLGDAVKHRAVVIFVVGFWVLDVANNMLQGPCRAFLADLARGNSSVTRTANALFSFFMGVGNVGGYALGSYSKLYESFSFTKTDACDIFCANLKSCFFISALLLLTVTTIALIFVKEQPWSRSSEDDRPASSPFFGELLGAFKSLKKPMWLLLMVTCLNWVGWFAFLLYDTDWVGREVYGGDPKGSDRLKKLYDLGVRTGSLGLLLNSVVLGFVSLAIEPFGRRVGGVNKLWGIVNMIFAAGLFFTPLVTKIAERYRHDALAGGATSPPLPSASIKGGALAIFSVLGIPLAITYSVPFALASIFSNASGAGQGLSLGVLNLSIVLPQMFVSVTSGPWDNLFGGGNLPSFVVGGVSAAVSGLLAMFILPSPSPDSRPSTATVAFH